MGSMRLPLASSILYQYFLPFLDDGTPLAEIVTEFASVPDAGVTESWDGQGLPETTFSCLPL